MRGVKGSLGRVEGRVEELEADIKHLYRLFVPTPGAGRNGKTAKLSVEQKLLRLYADFQLLAKEAGVTLPR